MRLIATDLDGTLLGAGGTLSERNVQALHAAKDAGWYVVLASGRPPFMVSEYLPRLTNAVTHGVLANGSIVCTLPDQEMLHAIRFGVSMATDVVTRLRSLDVAYGFAMATDAGFAHEAGFAERMPAGQPVPATTDVLTAADGASEAIKLMVFHHHHTAHQLLDVLPPLLGDDLSVTHMGADCVEVGPTGIDKGTGLAWLCAHLGVAAGDVVSFGDEFNDHEMLRWLGRGIAMANGHPLTRELADEVTLTNVEDGVAVAIERMLADSVSSQHRVVVIGAGFGGLNVVRGLRRAPVDITLVDSHNFHTFQPLLYQVATAGLNADDVGYAVRGIFRRQRNVAVRMGTVDEIDVARRLVHTNNGPPIEYDTLVVAAGAVSNTFGVEGVDEHAFMLKSIDDAVELRTHLLGLFETTAGDPSTATEGTLDVVVCGGGPTGVEMAGGLVELYDKVLAKDFPQLDVTGARITLVEAGPRLLGTFTEPSGRRAMRTLERRRVQVITGVGVDRVAPDAVHLADGRRIAAHTVVWAAGVRASPLAEMLDVPLSRGGRIMVEPDLSVATRPEIFAVGDIAADEDAPLPQVAQPAIQGGRHVAEQIANRLAGRSTETFHYKDKGSMATIGRLDAVAEFPNGMRLSGPIGWVAWLGLHIVYLMGFRNRANVLVSWAWNYLTYDRGARLLAEGTVPHKHTSP